MNILRMKIILLAKLYMAAPQLPSKLDTNMLISPEQPKSLVYTRNIYVLLVI